MNDSHTGQTGNINIQDPFIAGAETDSNGTSGLGLEYSQEFIDDSTKNPSPEEGLRDFEGITFDSGEIPVDQEKNDSHMGPSDKNSHTSVSSEPVNNYPAEQFKSNDLAETTSDRPDIDFGDETFKYKEAQKIIKLSHEKINRENDAAGFDDIIRGKEGDVNNSMVSDLLSKYGKHSVLKKVA